MVGVSAPLVRGRVYTGYAMLCYTLFNTAFPYTLQKDHSDGDRDSLIQIRIKHFAKSKSGKGNNNLFHLSKFKNWKFNFFIYKRTKNRYLYVCDSHKKHIFIFNTLQNMYEQKKDFLNFFYSILPMYTLTVCPTSFCTTISKIVNKFFSSLSVEASLR